MAKKGHTAAECCNGALARVEAWIYKQRQANEGVAPVSRPTRGSEAVWKQAQSGWGP